MSRSLIKSFGFAIEGVKSAFVKGRNFRIQIFLGLLSLVLAYFLRFTRVEYAILVIAITLVLILELVNTAIEEAVDLVSPETNPKAKIAKDVAAGAVLTASIGSLSIGILLFIQKLTSLI